MNKLTELLLRGQQFLEMLFRLQKCSKRFNAETTFFHVLSAKAAEINGGSVLEPAKFALAVCLAL